MDPTTILLGLVAGAALGAGAVVAVLLPRLSAATQGREALDRKLAEREALHADREAHLEREIAVLDERLAARAEAEGRLGDRFAALSVSALERNARSFLELAEQRLSEAHTRAANDLEGKKSLIDQQL